LRKKINFDKKYFCLSKIKTFSKPKVLSKIKTFSKPKVLSKIKTFIKNHVSDKKNKTLVKNQSFYQKIKLKYIPNGQKSKFLSKNKTFVKNQSFCQKIKLLSKIKVFVKK